LLQKHELFISLFNSQAQLPFGAIHAGFSAFKQQDPFRNLGQFELLPV